MNRRTEVVQSQREELVGQSLKGTCFQLTLVTCPCGWKRGVTHCYRCLYCKVYFCHRCAEDHFGQSVEEYQLRKSDNGQ